MAFIKFTDTGYVCTEPDGYVLFQSENFKELFDFMYADLGYLQTLIKDYVESLIDIKTFDVKEKLSDVALEFYRLEFNKELAKIHPFFAHIPTYGNNLAMDYINDLLSEPFSIYNQTHVAEEQRNKTKKIINDVNAYSSLIDAVKQTQFFEDILLQNKFYDYAITAITYREKLVNRIHDKEPQRFVKATPAAEIKFAQDALKSLFYWVLDLNNKLVSNLNTARRYMLFEEIFGSSFYPMATSNVKKIIAYQPNVDLHMQFTNLQAEGEQLQHKKDGKLSATAAKQFESIKNKIQKQEEFYPATYNVNYILDLLLLEFDTIIRKSIKIRTCRNCGKYFIIKDSKIQYCDNIADGEEKPCNTIGKNKVFNNLLNEDAYLKIYYKCCRTKNRQKKRGKIDNNEWKEWKVAARKLLDTARKEKPPIEQFESNLVKLTLLKYSYVD